MLLHDHKVWCDEPAPLDNANTRRRRAAKTRSLEEMLILALHSENQANFLSLYNITTSQNGGETQ